MNVGVMLIMLARLTGGGTGALNSKLSTGPARSIFERAPLTQSGQTSRPLSSTSFSGSVGRPQMAQLLSRVGKSSEGGGSPTKVMAEVEAADAAAARRPARLKPAPLPQ